ncbi:DUF1992 domain-containing protein [Radiobacillus kanasensis]|uniref:DnaJ family domain-containing protein n=1 Tax=Radiobacillus kanasensis TaxID=2844358 RepID=UPI001E57CDDB|nr:DUF1992 domain-containing protein [Radiobacillus kanasensis]UFT99999.1 DUF1992 domain-containing protein [Radiobacillus kanasensis]
MDFVTLMAEEKIKKAISEGKLDNLEGKGKPLKLEDLSSIPEDMRTSYLMMKNSGYLPEEVKLNKELVQLRELIRCCEDPDQLAEHKKRLSEKEMHYDMLMEKRKLNSSTAFKRYSGKIRNRLGL